MKQSRIKKLSKQEWIYRNTDKKGIRLIPIVEHKQTNNEEGA